MEFAPDPEVMPEVRDVAVADEHLGLAGDYRPRHLSPSSAGLYQQCPRKWRHRYIDRLPDPPGEPALVGTFAHLVLEHLLQLPEGQRSKEAAKKLARDHWSEIEQESDYQALELNDSQAKASAGRRGKPSLACGRSKIPTKPKSTPLNTRFKSILPAFRFEASSTVSTSSMIRS